MRLPYDGMFDRSQRLNIFVKQGKPILPVYKNYEQNDHLFTVIKILLDARC